jgi:hypothetical protein
VPATESLSPVVPPLPVNYSGSGQQWSGYASLNWRPAPRLEVVTGLRSDSFLNQPGGTLVEPRLSAAWQVSPDQTLSFYSGELAKAPTAAQQVEAIGRLNPARAHESSLTFGQRDRHFSLQLSAFLKEYRDLTEANREFRTVGGNRGRARGFTAGISTNPVRKVTLGLDYTFSHSYRTDPDSGLMAPSAFDVRQTLSLTSKFQLGYSTLTIAYRFATGKPYTPVAGAIPGPAPGQFTPIYGSPESQRLPDFNRFDVSGSRLLFLHHQLWIPYLSIMNVLNQKNTYAYTYSADYRQKFAQPSLYRRTIYFGVSTVF